MCCFQLLATRENKTEQREMSASSHTISYMNSFAVMLEPGMEHAWRNMRLLLIHTTRDDDDACFRSYPAAVALATIWEVPLLLLVPIGWRMRKKHCVERSCQQSTSSLKQMLITSYIPRHDRSEDERIIIAGKRKYIYLHEVLGEMRDFLWKGFE